MRVWALLISLVLFLYAGAPPAYGDPCDPEAFSRLLEYVDDATAIKAEHLHYFKFPSDNVAFHRLAPSLAASDKVMFFHAENAVLKLLNDKILGDKQVSAALSNLYKRKFYEAIQADPVLRAAMVSADQGGMYSDYKSIRLAFHVENAETGLAVKKALNQAYESVAKSFQKEVDRYPSLREMYEGRSDLSGTPSTWNLAGVGADPEQAALSARQARTSSHLITNGQRLVPIQAFNKAMEKVLHDDLIYIEDFRMNLVHAMGNTFYGKRIFNEEGILVPSAISLLRRTENDPKISGEDDYIKTVRKRFFDRFGVTLTDANIKMLQTYFHRVNRYMPSIYADETETMHLAPMEGATHGAVSFDLRGAGDNNLHAAMLALKESADAVDNSPEKLTSSQVSALTLRKLRRNQDATSVDFLNTRSLIPQALTSQGVLHKADRVTFSGDEVTWLPDHDVSQTSMARGLHAIQKAMPPGQGIRAVVQPQNYEQTKIPLRPSTRFDWSSKMESYEKTLREYMGERLRDYYQSGELDKVQITVILRPQNDRSANISIWFSRDDRALTATEVKNLTFLTRQFANSDEAHSDFGALKLDKISTFNDVIQSAGGANLYLPQSTTPLTMP